MDRRWERSEGKVEKVEKGKSAKRGIKKERGRDLISHKDD